MIYTSLTDAILCPFLSLDSVVQLACTVEATHALYIILYIHVHVYTGIACIIHNTVHTCAHRHCMYIHTFMQCSTSLKF